MSAERTADPVVQVSGLEARYGDTVVLRDIDFEVGRGEVFVILGGSGCGKSTLLRHLIGLIPPYAGTIRIDGEELGRTEEERRPVLRKCGVMYQGGALFSSMTLAQNVALPLEEFTDLSPSAIQAVVRRKLALVALSGYEDHLPSELSGGMQKRAAVARALALDPCVLFCDEPSAGLDPVSSVDLDHLLLGLRDALGTTMVIVTHELQSIYTVADRCIMLDKARKTIVADGPPRELRDHSEDAFVRAFFRREPSRKSP